MCHSVAGDRGSFVLDPQTKCELPKATALDYWDSDVTVVEKDYELKDGSVTEIGKCCDTTRPASYEVLYDAFDKAGNKAQQVTINLEVIGKLHTFRVARRTPRLMNAVCYPRL